MLETYENGLQNIVRLDLRVVESGTEFFVRTSVGHRIYVIDVDDFLHAQDVPVGATMLNYLNQVVELVGKELEPEPELVYNFEVEDCHTYFVGDDAECCVLGHNEDCKIHDNNLFPDWIDNWVNAEKNGLNQFLFGKTINTCTCGQHTAPTAAPICPDALTQERLEGLSGLGSQMGNVTIVLASFNGPTVFFETVTGHRWHSTDGETVPLWERGLNAGTSAAGTSAFFWFLRKGARALTKADDIARGIVKSYGLLQCDECARHLSKQLTKHKINHKIWKIEANSDVVMGLKPPYPDLQISRNGIHYGVEIDGIIYDNIFKDGIPLDEWHNAFELPRNGAAFNPPQTITLKQIQ